MNVRARVDEQLDQRRRARNESAMGAERFRKRADHDDARIVECARQARALRSDDAERVRFVDEQHVIRSEIGEHCARDRRYRHPC